MALAAINVEKNARSANMELLHRKSSSQNFTEQQEKTNDDTCPFLEQTYNSRVICSSS